MLCIEMLVQALDAVLIGGPGSKVSLAAKAYEGTHSPFDLEESGCPIVVCFVCIVTRIATVRRTSSERTYSFWSSSQHSEGSHSDLCRK